MPARLVALLLSCVLLWSGLSTHESFDASLSAVQQDSQMAAPGHPSSDDVPGSVEGLPVDGLAACADLVEHAVLLAMPDPPGTTLTMLLSRHAGMTDVRSPLVDGLLRPPCAGSASA
ncbi:hypothetical protein M8A51_22760 [Schlegelella sp. S2-27]|uniref:Rap1a immunity protein domain-containing protein n=1 Tax=Caldimonas mangrovi TaxID=2944811 RepID=A0ABT0YUC8_9BURK|nr:hypothetical protein [Caldimonas mangrovi]MCM5682359.1 hypothetical protein [Caldimonas mangrovi]